MAARPLGGAQRISQLRAGNSIRAPQHRQSLSGKAKSVQRQRRSKPRQASKGILRSKRRKGRVCKTTSTPGSDQQLRRGKRGGGRLADGRRVKLKRNQPSEGAKRSRITRGNSEHKKKKEDQEGKGWPERQRNYPTEEKKLIREKKEGRRSKLKRRSEIYILREAKIQKRNDSKMLMRWRRRRKGKV